MSTNVLQKVKVLLEFLLETEELLLDYVRKLTEVLRKYASNPEAEKALSKTAEELTNELVMVDPFLATEVAIYLQKLAVITDELNAIMNYSTMHDLATKTQVLNDIAKRLDLTLSSSRDILQRVKLRLRYG